jgi:UDP-3-O-[3-hydroxymyristoyl] glucosamine N-acyltransferase
MKKSLKSPPLATTVAALAQLMNCPHKGDGNTKITGVSTLEDAKKGDIVYLAHPKYQALLEATDASAAVIPPDMLYDKIPVITSENPHLSFIKAVNYFFPPRSLQPGIHLQAVVSPSAKLGKNVSVGALSIIGDDVELGEGTIIYPLVVVYPKVRIGRQSVIHSHVCIREDCWIGDRVTLHSGVVIGSDGFGYLQAKDKSHIKIPQVGYVVIEDDVEIGANSTVDRASLGKTVIKRGTKIDNLVQIAHNVEIGEHSILAAQTGIAGSTKVGKNVVLGGQVGISDHVRIGDDVIAAAKSGITKDIPSGSFVAGIPHFDVKEWRKAWASIPQLYDLLKEVRKLRKRIEDLESK